MGQVVKKICLKNTPAPKIYKEDGLEIFCQEEEKMNKQNLKNNFIKKERVCLNVTLYLWKKIFVKNKTQVLHQQKPSIWPTI